MTFRHLLKGEYPYACDVRIEIPMLGILKGLLIKAHPETEVIKIEFHLNSSLAMEIPTDFLNVLWIPITLPVSNSYGTNPNNMAIYYNAYLKITIKGPCEISVWEELE